MDSNVTRDLMIGSGATLNTNAGSFTISGNLTDDGQGGGLVITGGGSLSLTGSNTYTGGTIINASTTLTVAGTPSLGTGGIVLNNGSLATTANLETSQSIDLWTASNVIDTRGNLVSLSGPIRGDGGIIFTGGNTVRLNGANTFQGGTTITNGTTVRIAGADGLGSGAVTLSNGTLAADASMDSSQPIMVTGQSNVIDTGNNMIRLSNSVGGNGALTVTGGNRLTLNGQNTFAGTLDVVGNTLFTVGGSGTSDGSLNACDRLSVRDFSTLGGVGIVCPVRIFSTGARAPGNSIGTLTVQGALTLDAGSRTVIEVSPTTADKVTVSDTASLQGSLAVSCENGACGTSIGLGTTYTILTAQRGVAGAFTGVTSTVPSTRFDTLYAANTVRIVATPQRLSDLSGAGISLAQNQTSVAEALDRLRPAAGTRLTGGAATFFESLYTQSASSLASTYSGLSGEVHGAIGPLAAQSTNLLTSAALADWRREPAGQGEAPGARVRVGGDESAMLWAAPVATQTRFSGDSAIGANRRTSRLAGYVVGLDTNAVGGVTFGGGLSALDGRATVTRGLGEATTRELHGVAYATGQFTKVSWGGATSYGKVDVNANRGLPVDGGATTSSSYQATVWSGRLTAAYPLTAVAGFALDPYVGIEASSARVPGFQESQTSSAALTVAARTDWTSRADLGVRATTRGNLSERAVRGSVSAAFRRYMQREAGFTGALSGFPGQSFSIVAARQAGNVAVFGTSLGISLTNRVSVDAQVDGEVSGQATGVGGSARLAYRF